MNFENINPLIGYRLQNKAEIGAVQAAGFEYVLAGNGLWVRAANSWLEACVPVALAQVRGLPEAKPYVGLNTPKVGMELTSTDNLK
jgi:hypothetical protein